MLWLSYIDFYFRVDVPLAYTNDVLLVLLLLLLLSSRSHAFLIWHRQIDSKIFFFITSPKRPRHQIFILEIFHLFSSQATALFFHKFIHSLILINEFEWEFFFVFQRAASKKHILYSCFYVQHSCRTFWWRLMNTRQKMVKKKIFFYMTEVGLNIIRITCSKIFMKKTVFSDKLFVIDFTNAIKKIFVALIFYIFSKFLLLKNTLQIKLPHKF